jgi:hypothetical protein
VNEPRLLVAITPPRGVESCENRAMWTILRKFGCLFGVTLIQGLVSQVRGADAGPFAHRVTHHGVTDFHHSEWNGIGAVFDIKQSSEGYLWLKTSKRASFASTEFGSSL